MEKVTKRIIFFGLLIACILLYGNYRLTRWKRVIIESPDKSQSITIITKDTVRYIMNGRHRFIQNSNCAKLNINQISPIGDEVAICWDVEGYNWRLVNPYSIFIESNLDSSLYIVQKELEKNEHGAPTLKKYLYDNCVRISIRENRISPVDGAFLDYYWF